MLRGNNMFVVHREKGWFDPKTEYRIWKNLCNAYNETFVFLEDYTTTGNPVVVLEEAGDILLEDFIHPANADYVFGRSCLNNLRDITVHDYTVRVEMPDMGQNVFGICVASIVLADRERKTWQ
jgi:hypothetical protein